MNSQLYDPKKDPQFQKPYIDIDDWRCQSVRYRYIHGGFEGTETRFSFFFPEKDAYKGRFFQFMAPVQGSEDASIHGLGEENKISFAVSHGAYFVESNMGVAVPFAPIPDPTIIYKASAAVACYSRVVASELYGPHRPFGYLYGGSGGAFKTFSCVENTTTWDGAVPYVPGTPMSIPNCFTVRAHAKRLLRHRLSHIADAVEPGGRDPAEKLEKEEREALEEVTQFGFPTRVWFLHDRLDDGSLPILAPLVQAEDPQYFKDFWTLPGYLGSDPEGSAVRDRIQLKTIVKAVHIPSQGNEAIDLERTGVDDAWQRSRGDAALNGRVWLRIRDVPECNAYVYNATLKVLSGQAAGFTVPVEQLIDDRIIIGPGFGIDSMIQKLSSIQPGDEIYLDNSDYLAIQTFHRHQVPDKSYVGWDQFRDADGNPIYPQRPELVGPKISYGGAGSIQSGRFHGKMIILACLMDESAFPWQADWYRQKAKQWMDSEEKDRFRLWYMDHAMHADQSWTVDEKHVVSYLGALHQALLYLSDWVERGIEPPESSVYTIEKGQVLIPDTASERKGIQPVVKLSANGAQSITIKAGETVHFSATAEVPAEAGRLTFAEWSFDGHEAHPFTLQDAFPVKGVFSEMTPDGAKAKIRADYVFRFKGVYFPTLRIKSQKQGNAGDIFTQIKNICRVRVIVE